MKSREIKLLACYSRSVRAGWQVREASQGAPRDLQTKRHPNRAVPNPGSTNCSKQEASAENANVSQPVLRSWPRLFLRSLRTRAGTWAVPGLKGLRVFTTQGGRQPCRLQPTRFRRNGGSPGTLSQNSLALPARSGSAPRHIAPGYTPQSARNKQGRNHASPPNPSTPPPKNNYF